MLYVHGDMLGVRPEMAPVFSVIPEIFGDLGFRCVLTSCVRPDPHSFHGYGLAADFDAPAGISYPTGVLIAGRAEAALGKDYTCLWHKTFGGEWHLHVEFDPGRQGLEKFLARGLSNGLGVSPPPASNPGPSPTGGH